MKGRRFSVGAGGVRLGRSSSNDIHIPDEELSRNHCLLEQSGDEIRITDLASANGTFVNGEKLGADSRVLHVGDSLEVGSTNLMVVGDEEKSVDLGLGTAPAADKDAGAEGGASPDAKSRRSPLANVLWIVAALVVAAAIAVVMYTPRESKSPVVPAERSEAPRELVELRYEKVEADASRIFRYEMTIDRSGVLHVVYDDVPGEDRHVDKQTQLSPVAIKRIFEILDTTGFSSLENVYSGSSVADENALRSYRVRVVEWNKTKDILVENSPEPEPFRLVREALEAFSRNELGIWAIQYSREKLLELSAASDSVGDAKWNEREVEYGNLSAAVKAYREAAFYLDTINPKPHSYSLIKEKLRKAEGELKIRYENQRFLADKAINLADWEAALVELRVLCAMVPEKDDPRHAEANARLVDVENRIKKARYGK